MYEWKSNHNAAAAARNFDSAFINGSVNERTIRSWDIKLKIGKESLRNEKRADQILLWTMKFYEQYLKNKPRNIVRDHVEEQGVSPTTISCHLKLIGKVKKIGKWVLHELNENYKRKRFETSSALLLYI